jgi:hypothetical protein
MNQSLGSNDRQRSRAVTAVTIMAMALERNAPHMALAAAQEAARSALLVLASAPRRLAAAELEILTQMAASSPQHLAGRPAERHARVHAAFMILDHLFPRAPTCEVSTVPLRPEALASAYACGTGGGVVHS